MQQRLPDTSDCFPIHYWLFSLHDNGQWLRIYRKAWFIRVKDTSWKIYQTCFVLGLLQGVEIMINALSWWSYCPSKGQCCRGSQVHLRMPAYKLIPPSSTGGFVNPTMSKHNAQHFLSGPRVSESNKNSTRSSFSHIVDCAPGYTFPSLWSVRGTPTKTWCFWYGHLLLLHASPIFSSDQLRYFRGLLAAATGDSLDSLHCLNILLQAWKHTAPSQNESNIHRPRETVAYSQMSYHQCTGTWLLFENNMHTS